MTTMADRYRKWFAYEKDAHRKTLSSLETVPAERRADPDFVRAVGLVGHLVAARQLWLFRFGVRAKGPSTVAELFPENISLEELSKSMDDMHLEWSEYLRDLDDAGIARVFEYRALEGERFRNRVEDLLTQLFGHSCYHRGQVAALVRSLGGTPAVTDYVFWVREPVE